MPAIDKAQSPAHVVSFETTRNNVRRFGDAINHDAGIPRPAISTPRVRLYLKIEIIFYTASLSSSTFPANEEKP